MQRDKPRWPPEGSWWRPVLQFGMVLLGIVIGVVAGAELGCWLSGLGPPGTTSVETQGVGTLYGAFAGVPFGAWLGTILAIRVFPL